MSFYLYLTGGIVSGGMGVACGLSSSSMKRKKQSIEATPNLYERSKHRAFLDESGLRLNGSNTDYYNFEGIVCRRPTSRSSTITDTKKTLGMTSGKTRVSACGNECLSWSATSYEVSKHYDDQKQRTGGKVLNIYCGYGSARDLLLIRIYYRAGKVGSKKQ